VADGKNVPRGTRSRIGRPTELRWATAHPRRLHRL